MKQSLYVRREAEQRTKAMTTAADVYRVALADLTNAKPGETLRDALVRMIDERIEAQRRPFWKFWA